MPLCFIEPQDAIRVIAESVGREARRQLLGELVRAWVDEIPEGELESHYAKAVADLDEHDLSMLAAWHASLEVGQPIANRDFLVTVFSSLGDNRREALKIAAGFRGEEAFDAGVAEEQALETVLPAPVARARDGARGGVPRALPLGPAGLRQLDGRASSASSSAIACSVSRNQTACMPSRAARRRMLCSMSSTNSARLGGQPEPLERQLVDRRVGLAHPDEGRVDDDLEELVDRQHRAPARLPLADVVGQQRHAQAAARARRSSRRIGVVGVEAGEVVLGERRPSRPARPSSALELVAERGEEVVPRSCSPRSSS